MAHPGWSRLIRTEDFIWLFLFSAMVAVSPRQSYAEITLLSCLCLFQIAEPRMAALATPTGRICSILLKLFAGYLLIYYTGGLESGYYLILLLPVVSAATSLGFLGTSLFAVLACLAYLSFALYIDWSRYFIPAEEGRELILRLIFLALFGYLTHTLGEASRVETRKYQAAAEQLAAANQSLREAEAAVRRSERLAALGQLTAGLAHELRNPLGTIKVSAEVLSKNLPEGDAVAREMTGYILEEVDRTSSLITRFLEFARPFQLRLKPADLTEIIDRAIALLERRTPRFEVTIYRNYSPDVPPFSFDAELMERVFYNLLQNAAEATAPGGAITVKTRPIDSTVEISVIDRGSGIERGQIENIFNPFFTTKSTGVGLGLAIVSKIVDEHGGKVAVESQYGKGSVFRVLLPTG